jgi:hypothetical protein
MRPGKKFSFCALLIAVACNSGGEKVNEQKPQNQPDTLAVNNNSVINADTTISGCYTQVFNRDTAYLQLEIKDSNITGPLTYNIFQKDRNEGSIKAEIADSLITGWYLFKSEGIISVRQVAWRIKPGQLWPATGKMIQRNDTTMFANPDKLEFDSKRPFVKVKCVV